MMSSCQQFKYPALPNGRQRYVRLLRLLEDGSNEIPQKGDLRGELQQVSLDEICEDSSRTEYFALSYCWGDSNPVDHIWLGNNELLLLTASAAYALRYLPKNVNFWIDAICINQCDKTEKAEQVTMIWDIFHNAKAVYASIGGPENDAALALKIVNEHACMLAEDVTDLSLVWLNISDGEFETAFQRYSASWRALSSLLSRPWFRRAWVIQETVAAKEVILFSDGEMASWNRLTDLIERLRKFGRLRYLYPNDRSWQVDLDALSRGLNRISQVNAFRRLEVKNPELLQQYLAMSYYAEASDPRDKIFAVVPLACDQLVNELKPAYGLPVERVFINATMYLMTEYRSFFLLHLAGIGWYRSFASLPSWVPDYANPSGGQSSLLRPKEDLWINGSSGFYPTEWKLAEILSSPDSDRIVVQSRYIDEVKIVHKEWSFDQSVQRVLTHGKYADRLKMLSWFNRIRKEFVDSQTINLFSAIGYTFYKRPGGSYCFKDSGKCCDRSLDKSSHPIPVLSALTCALMCQSHHGYQHRELSECYDAFQNLLLRAVASSKDSLDPKIFETKQAKTGLAVAEEIDRFARWAYFETKNGYVGRGPPDVQQGDRVQVFRGFDYPVITRKVSSSLLGLVQEARFVGAACLVNYHREDIHNAQHETTWPLVLF